MRKFTKSMLTLALLVLAVGSVNAADKREKVYEKDWTAETSYPYYRMGVPSSTPESSYDVTDGALVIVNNATGKGYWEYQPFIADWLTLTVGATYEIDVTYKSTMASNDVHIAMGTWSSSKDAACSIIQTDEWAVTKVTLTDYPVAGNNDIHILWQCGSVVGTMQIAKVEVFLITPEGTQESVTYGDLVDVTPEIWVKENNGSTDLAVPDGDGVITINNNLTDGADHLTQLWIGTPNAGLPAGQKFYVKFECKADKATTVGTQTHTPKPGDYIHWDCIGDVTFGTEWKTFEKTVTIENSMSGWKYIAFNMNKNEVNNYYIKNVELKVPETSEAVGFSISNAGWATFSCGKDVNLGTAKAYGAQYNGSYVELTPASELPAGEAVVIEAAGVSKYSFEVITGATSPTNNDLLVSDGNVEGDGTIYVLANKGGKAGFYKLGDGVKVPAGKGYLKVSAGAPDFIGFDGTTGIETVKTTKANGEYYNLAGQRVAQPTKGLYIVNGKKVVIK